MFLTPSNIFGSCDFVTTYPHLGLQDAQRRLAEAQSEIALLHERSKVLEELASTRLASLEDEVCGGTKYINWFLFTFG